MIIIIIIKKFIYNSPLLTSLKGAVKIINQQLYAALNKCDLSKFLNCSNVSRLFLREAGREFHIAGAAKRKLRGPMCLVRVRG